MLEHTDVDSFYLKQRSANSGLFLLLQSYWQEVGPRLWLLIGCFDLGCSYLLNALGIEKVITSFVPCILTKMSFVFPLLFGLGFIKFMRNKCGWIQYSLGCPLTPNVSCVSVVVLYLCFFYLLFPNPHAPLQARTNKPGGPQLMVLPRCWIGRQPSSLIVCERYLLSITLLPGLLSSFTDNRAQILYFQWGLKPAEFQDLSERLAPVYTVEESSPVALFKVTIVVEDTMATAMFVKENI